VKIVKILGNLADIDNTQDIKTLICTAKVSEGRKELYSNAYDHYTRYNLYGKDEINEPLLPSFLMFGDVM
jgi:hypothetical protein